LNYRLLWWSQIGFGAGAVVLALVALSSWILSEPLLASFSAAYVTMKPNTALAILALALATILIAGDPAKKVLCLAARVLPLLAALIGITTFIEYALQVDLRIDQLFFAEEAGAPHTPIPGRMAIATALCIVMLGVGLFTVAARWNWSKRLPDALGLLSALISIFVLLGYLLGHEVGLTDVGLGGTQMALPTAIAFFLISTTLMTLRPDERLIAPIFSNSPAGTVLKWLLPAAVLVPAGIGWLRLKGEVVGMYGTAAGVALTAAATIALFLTLVFTLAYMLDEAHRNSVKAERATRELDSRFRTLLNHAPVRIYTMDLDGRFTFINGGVQEGLSGSSDNLIGKTAYDLFPADKASAYRANDLKVIESGRPYDFEEIVDLPSGRRVYLSSKFPLLNEDGIVCGLGGVSTDVTEHWRAVRQLDKFFELSISMHCIASMDGYFVRLNPAWEKTLGYSVDELTAKPFMEFVHPDDRESTLDAVKDLSEGKRIISFENRYRCRDGSYRLLLWNSMPSLDDQCIYAGAVDITEQREAEKEIVNLNSELRRHTAHLQSINRELESFSYSVSHDLRAPLRSIDGFSLALMEDYAARLDDSGRDYLARIRRATQRMGTLIDDMLALSRISRASINMTTTDLSALARDVVQGLRERDRSRAVRVSIEESMLATGDPKLLRIVLENLIGNAWKYSSKNPNAVIEVGTEIRDNTTIYFVRDNGVGFDMKYADKLFGAFQRLHSSDEFEGTGIGLAIVQRILHRHGGDIWAEAEVGRGTTIRFCLEPVGKGEEVYA
jgi:PAS domain S-box-containing protein